MEELIEYHKLVFLVSNFTSKESPRPTHIINTAKDRFGHLRSIFVQLDDGALNILTNAQMVGAGVQDDKSLVIVI